MERQKVIEQEPAQRASLDDRFGMILLMVFLQLRLKNSISTASCMNFYGFYREQAILNILRKITSIFGMNGHTKHIYKRTIWTFPPATAMNGKAELKNLLLA